MNKMNGKSSENEVRRLETIAEDSWYDRGVNSNAVEYSFEVFSRSLHRQATVSMGLLESEHSMNENDIHHGHRRIFDPETFRQAFLSSGLAIEVFGGYWMKPVSNAQIEKSWTPEMLQAFMQLGERHPDISGEIYIIAKLK